jgi:hypothetical protein
MVAAGCGSAVRDQRPGVGVLAGDSVRAELAMLDAGGGWLPTTSAMGTMMMPRNTVTTKVTAPHSRKKKDRFTSWQC